ncbi:unnamed protein product [Orchesella dallaii]|uniref:Uncharacterized protein n=1 Tax=Orchesella dallaii TaxID=48710 RepID=A0ABP1R7R9_9HEXA
MEPTFSSSGSGSGSGSSGSHSSSSGSKKTSSSAEGSNETGTVQTVELEPSRPGLYKRIACIRYVICFKNDFHCNSSVMHG